MDVSFLIATTFCLERRIPSLIRYTNGGTWSRLSAVEQVERSLRKSFRKTLGRQLDLLKVVRRKGKDPWRQSSSPLLLLLSLSANEWPIYAIPIYSNSAPRRMLDYPAEIRPRLPLPRYKANVKQRELVVLLVILWLLLLVHVYTVLYVPFLFFEGGGREEGGKGLHIGRKFSNLRFF